MRHLLSITDLSVEEIDELLNTAADIEANPDKYAHALAGKKLATLFFEPSTRTRLSFEAAMYELGGQVLGFSEAQSSSAAKGESVEEINKKTEALNKAMEPIAKKIYENASPEEHQAAQDAARAYQQQAQQQQGQQAGSSKKDDDGVVDADYKIVDE